MLAALSRCAGIVPTPRPLQPHPVLISFESTQRKTKGQQLKGNSRGKFHKQPVPPRHSRLFPGGLPCPRASGCLLCRCTFALYCPNIDFLFHGSLIGCVGGGGRFGVLWCGYENQVAHKNHQTALRFKRINLAETANDWRPLQHAKHLKHWAFGGKHSHKFDGAIGNFSLGRKRPR